MKFFILTISLIVTAFAATIPQETENTEIIPDVTSALLDVAESTATDVERTKKSPAVDTKTICFETLVDGKSILQCADEPETSETLSIPSILPAAPSSIIRQGQSSGFPLPGLNLPTFPNLGPNFAVILREF